MTINQLNDFPSLVRFFILIFLCFNLAACFEPTFEGYSPIQNGLVQAYLIEEADGVSRIASEPVGELVATDEKGFFTLVLPQYSNTEQIVVQVFTTDESTYSCMLIDGCVEESLPDGFSLWSGLPELRIAETPMLNVGILSHLAINLAQRNPRGLTKLHIDEAYRNIEARFDLSLESIFKSHLALSGLMQVDESLDGLEDPLRAMLIESAFISIAGSEESIGIVDVKDAAEDFFVLQLASSGGIQLSVEDLWANASQHASNLSLKEQSFDRRAVLLNAVSQLNSSKLVENGYETEPLEIMLQPMPQTIREGQSASLRVTTKGSGLISYQWYRDGIEIAGARAPSLVVDNANSADQGKYHVRISNETGSLISHQVMLIVTREEDATSNGAISDGAFSEGTISNGTSSNGTGSNSTGSNSTTSNSTTSNSTTSNSTGPVNNEIAMRIQLPIVINMPKINITIPDEQLAENGGHSGNESENSSVDDGVQTEVPMNDGGSEGSVGEEASGMRREVALNWTIPLNKTSGESLGLWEISGYSLIYGNEPDALNSRIFIPGAFGLRYNIEGLIPASYYFAVATVDTAGDRGPYSETIHLDLR